MKPRYRLETLGVQHTITQFACGDAEIDEYLRQDALSDMERGFAHTFVEIDRNKPATENVAGYFTLRADLKCIREDYFAERYGDVVEYNSAIEVPLVELMWLARDLRWKGMGIGDILMLDALQMVAQAAERIGLMGLHLRATDHGKKLYETYDFSLFRAHPAYDGRRYLLHIEDIREIVASIDNAP